MEAERIGKKLCVIGAGALGLVTTKNFIEQGFDVITYERNDYVGGLWHVTKDLSQTSVLQGTRANISKHGVNLPSKNERPAADKQLLRHASLTSRTRTVGLDSLLATKIADLTTAI